MFQENRYLKKQIKFLNKNNKGFDKSSKQNYIKAEYLISEDETNQDIRILNHDEEKEEYSYDSYGAGYHITGADNKEEIEESCTIYFGNNPISFRETFNFYKPGKYTFTFEFKYKLENINRLFYDCANLFSVDFSHFDSSGIKELSSIFENCSNLKYIDFSRFYLPKGKASDNIFYGVHNKCRLITKDKNLENIFESDKTNYEHKDDYFDDYFD